MTESAELLKAFRSEAADHLDALERRLQDPAATRAEPDGVKLMFIAVHTIKGGSAMLGMNAAWALAAAMEDVLAPLRDTQRRPEPDAAALLLEGSAVLRGMIFEPSDADAVHQSRLVEALRNLVDHSSDHEQQRDATNPVRDKAAPGALRRVLLVDERPMARMVVTTILRDAGFDVEALPAGEAALRRLRGEAVYELLVIGERVQGMEPTALTAAVQTERPHLPIIVVGAADAEARPNGGMLRYVAVGNVGQAQLVALARAVGHWPSAGS